jgi:hypothetical protein
MAYQHLGLNFGGNTAFSQGTSSATHSTACAPVRSRIDISDLLNSQGNNPRIPGSGNVAGEPDKQALSVEVARLRVQIQGMNPGAPQPMFSDSAEIERVRELAASAPKKTLTPVVPGFKSDELTVGEYQP